MGEEGEGGESIFCCFNYFYYLCTPENKKDAKDIAGDILQGLFAVDDEEERTIDVQTGMETIRQPSKRFEVKFRRKG